ASAGSRAGRLEYRRNLCGMVSVVIEYRDSVPFAHELKPPFDARKRPQRRADRFIAGTGTGRHHDCGQSVERVVPSWCGDLQTSERSGATWNPGAEGHIEYAGMPVTGQRQQSRIGILTAPVGNKRAPVTPQI